MCIAKLGCGGVFACIWHTCRYAFEEVMLEEIGLHPSSKILELQTHSKGLLVRFSIKVAPVIAISNVLMTLREGLYIHAN